MPSARKEWRESTNVANVRVIVALSWSKVSMDTLYVPGGPTSWDVASTPSVPFSLMSHPKIWPPSEVESTWPSPTMAGVTLEVAPCAGESATNCTVTATAAPSLPNLPSFIECTSRDVIPGEVRAVATHGLDPGPVIGFSCRVACDKLGPLARP